VTYSEKDSAPIGILDDVPRLLLLGRNRLLNQQWYPGLDRCTRKCRQHRSRRRNAGKVDLAAAERLLDRCEGGGALMATREPLPTYGVGIDGRNDLYPFDLGQHPRVERAHMTKTRDQRAAGCFASVGHAH